MPLYGDERNHHPRGAFIHKNGLFKVQPNFESSFEISLFASKCIAEYPRPCYEPNIRGEPLVNFYYVFDPYRYSELGIAPQCISWNQPGFIYALFLPVGFGSIFQLSLLVILDKVAT